MEFIFAPAAQRAAELGHELEWETVGANLTRGRCVRCCATISLIHGKYYGSSVEETDIETPCPGSNGESADG